MNGALAAQLLGLLPSIVALGAGGGGGFYAVKWFVEWLAGRFDKQRAALDQGWKEYRVTLEGDLATLRGEIAKLQKEVAACHLREANAEARAIRLEAMFQGIGDAKQLLQVIASQQRAADVPIAADIAG